ncbi:MAG: phospholipase D-like domain-containing protein [Jaaginema sp. PMC 1079.18]|nr:phospholipase D-like domain-containing protein [Jaaginema sp. PMC 1080.18]MEC4850480.1 phospholipase D-like domain-containing protein [Jaaginema sp. PMC 1079.18]MEC4867538.1 phospholipase D-like domain-containing protein [Jaaginema sp. PMC 1078.18]
MDWFFIGWNLGSILLLVVLFIVGILYFQGFFGRYDRFHVKNLPPTNAPNFELTLASLSDAFITHGRVVGFWEGADAIHQARLDAIASAEKSIQFETYFMTPGDRADNFAQALRERAQAGVAVQVIADHHGSKDLSDSYWQRLREAGILITQFNQFTWKDPLSHLRRNHRKLLVIDGHSALIGGAGISDHWDGLPEFGDTEPWLDYEIRIEGAVVMRLKGIFFQHWLDAGGVVDFAQDPLEFVQNSNDPMVLIAAGEDPSMRDSSIRALYQSAIRAARERVWITSPYFLPDPGTREILIETRQKGIDVRILTMGPHTDKPYVRYTSRERYRQLLQGDVAIHEYQPSMMHAKMLLVDDSWVSFGSANFDPRSFFQNDELNVATAELDVVQQFDDYFLRALRKSDRVYYKEWQKRSFKERFVGKFWLLFYWQL